MPKVTHLICMTAEHKVSSKDFPEHINLLTFNEVEISGALPDNSKYHHSKPPRCIINEPLGVQAGLTPTKNADLCLCFLMQWLKCVLSCCKNEHFLG